MSALARRFALSLVIPVGPRDGPALERLLASIDRQAFPKDHLEVLLQYEGNSEEARAAGIAKAQGDIIGCLDADNQLLGFEFLSRMHTEAGLPGVVGAYPSHYAWMSSDPPLNRYFALLGVNDPLAWWLGKADRRSWLVAPRTEQLVFGGSLPTLGSNGFFVKRQAAQPFVAAWARSHIDGCEAMRAAGLDTYTLVDSVLWHHTGDSWWGYLRKRFTYALRHGFDPARRWHLVEPRDLPRVALFGLASCLVLPHLWLSLRGYRRVRDVAWFLHPLVCGSLTCMYVLALVIHLARRWWSARLG